MKQRDLWRKFGRPLHVLYGVAELAVLVGDDPEQVFGFGHVRLRLENLAANRLRFHQLALAAAAFGVASEPRRAASLSVWPAVSP